jgi:hypothetical protein
MGRARPRRGWVSAGRRRPRPRESGHIHRLGGPVRESHGERAYNTMEKRIYRRSGMKRRAKTGGRGARAIDTNIGTKDGEVCVIDTNIGWSENVRGS